MNTLFLPNTGAGTMSPAESVLTKFDEIGDSFLIHYIFNMKHSIIIEHFSFECDVEYINKENKIELIKELSPIHFNTERTNKIFNLRLHYKGEDEFWKERIINIPLKNYIFYWLLLAELHGILTIQNNSSKTDEIKPIFKSLFGDKEIEYGIYKGFLKILIEEKKPNLKNATTKYVMEYINKRLQNTKDDLYLFLKQIDPELISLFDYFDNEDDEDENKEEKEEEKDKKTFEILNYKEIAIPSFKTEKWHEYYKLLLYKQSHINKIEKNNVVLILGPSKKWKNSNNNNQMCHIAPRYTIDLMIEKKEYLQLYNFLLKYPLNTTWYFPMINPSNLDVEYAILGILTPSDGISGKFFKCFKNQEEELPDRLKLIELLKTRKMLDISFVNNIYRGWTGFALDGASIFAKMGIMGIFGINPVENLIKVGGNWISSFENVKNFSDYNIVTYIISNIVKKAYVNAIYSSRNPNTIMYNYNYYNISSITPKFITKIPENITNNMIFRDQKYKELSEILNSIKIKDDNYDRLQENRQQAAGIIPNGGIGIISTSKKELKKE
jgi:hypothetical protein